MTLGLAIIVAAILGAFLIHTIGVRMQERSAKRNAIRRAAQPDVDIAVAMLLIQGLDIENLQIITDWVFQTEYEKRKLWPRSGDTIDSDGLFVQFLVSNRPEYGGAVNQIQQAAQEALKGHDL